MKTNETKKLHIRMVSHLLAKTGTFRLRMGGRVPDNYTLQVLERSIERSGSKAWVTCASYRYADQFFCCSTAANFLREASAADCGGTLGLELERIADCIKVRIKK